MGFDGIEGGGATLPMDDRSPGLLSKLLLMRACSCRGGGNQLAHMCICMSVSGQEHVHVHRGSQNVVAICLRYC